MDEDDEGLRFLKRRVFSVLDPSVDVSFNGGEERFEVLHCFYGSAVIDFEHGIVGGVEGDGLPIEGVVFYEVLDPLGEFVRF